MIQDFIAQHSSSRYVEDARRLISELQGVDYYEKGRLLDAYVEFKKADEMSLREENRGKYAACEEYVEYLNLQNDTSYSRMLEFLDKYPNSRYYKEVSKLASSTRMKMRAMQSNGNQQKKRKDKTTKRVALGMVATVLVSALGFSSIYLFGDFRE